MKLSTTKNSSSGQISTVTATVALVGTLIALIVLGPGNGATAVESKKMTPIAQWSLDEGNGATSADRYGNSPLTLVGNPNWVRGVSGTALRFSGEGQYAETKSAVVDTSGDFTISAWVTLDSIPGFFATAVSQDGVPPLNPFYLQYGEGGFIFTTPGGPRALTVMTPQIGKWYHLVGVHDNEVGENRLFVDGKLLVKAPSVMGSPSEGAFTIGRAASGGNRADFWKGAIDEVKVFDRVLSADEVRELNVEFIPKHQAVKTQEKAAPPPEPIVAGVASLGILAVVAAAIIWRRRRRRGRASAGVPFDDSLLRTDTSASWMVDRSLRVLLAGLERMGMQVPKILGVFIEGSSVRLKLAGPAANPPSPWTASEDGQSWSAGIDRLQREPLSDGSMDSFARLVSLGLAESGRVFVNFSLARGPITLEGPTPAVHEVLRRWLGELVANPWSDEPRVVMIGNGLPQPREAEQMANLEQLVPELETHSRGILVLSQAPSSAQQALLISRFASPAFGWVVIVLTSTATAKWRFSVDDNGFLHSTFLPDVQYVDRPYARRRVWK